MTPAPSVPVQFLMTGIATPLLTSVAKPLSSGACGEAPGASGAGLSPPPPPPLSPGAPGPSGFASFGLCDRESALSLLLSPSPPDVRA